MNIKRNQNTNATNFEYLSVGTVFKDADSDSDSDSDSDLYMRIVDIGTYDGCTINAIALESGEATYFADCESVVVIDGKFVYHE